MLRHCLDSCNHNIEFAAITEIIATYEGEPDQHDWRWIVALRNKKYAFIRAGCTVEEGSADDWYVVSLQFENVADALRAAMGVKGVALVVAVILNDFQSDDEVIDVVQNLKAQTLDWLTRKARERDQVLHVAPQVA